MPHRIFFILSGVFLLLGGFWAMLAPFAASVAATLYAGAAFAVGGLLHIIAAFRSDEDRLWNASFGLLGIALGVSFAFNPFGGMLSLTILLGALFFASGLMQLYFVWKRRATDSVWMLALSGVVSVVLSGLIAGNIFAATLVLPGVVLAIELITTGVALLLMRPLKEKVKEPEGTPFTA
ncbi:MAG: DUF308 domain-containing protein [Pseudomonadota bacterium]